VTASEARHGAFMASLSPRTDINLIVSLSSHEPASALMVSLSNHEGVARRRLKHRVIPAKKAGIQAVARKSPDSVWIPTFVGMTPWNETGTVPCPRDSTDSP